MTKLPHNLLKKLEQQAPEALALLNQSNVSLNQAMAAWDPKKLRLNHEETSTLLQVIKQQNNPAYSSWINALLGLKQVHHTLKQLHAQLHTDVAIFNQQGRPITLRLQPNMISNMEIHVDSEDYDPDDEEIYTPQSGAHFYCESLHIKLDVDVLRKQCPALFDSTSTAHADSHNSDPSLVSYVRNIEWAVTRHIQYGVGIKWEALYYTTNITQQQLAMADSEISPGSLPLVYNPFML